MLSSGLDSLSATCLQILSAFLLGLGYDYFCTFMNIINTSTVFIQCLFFTPPSSRSLTSSNPQLLQLQQLLQLHIPSFKLLIGRWLGKCFGTESTLVFSFFLIFVYVFSSICWDVRWSQENSIEHNKELAAALRWTGDSNVAMSFIGCGPQPPKTVSSLLTPGCNTLDSDIKQFALLCEQNVEALWRSV